MLSARLGSCAHKCTDGRSPSGSNRKHSLCSSLSGFCPQQSRLDRLSADFVRSSRKIGSVMKNPVYVLGHSDFELQRLARQAKVLRPTTREWFQAAGMAPGMRV